MASPSAIRAGEAYVQIIADISVLEHGLRQARKRLAEFGESIKAIGAGMFAAGTAIAAPLVAAAKITGSVGDEYLKMAQRTGASVEALSALAYAAGMTDLSMSDVEVGIKNLQKTLTEAAKGGRSANAALERLGLNLDQLQRLTPDAQLQAVGQALKGISDPALRTTLALEILGRSGTSLLPLLNALPELRAEAQQVGMVMSTDTARAAAAMDDEFKRIKNAALSVTLALGQAVAPVIKEFADLVVRGAEYARGWIREHEAVIQAALKLGAALVVAGAGVSAFGFIAQGIGSLTGAIAPATNAVRGFAGALAAMNLASLPALLTQVAGGFTHLASALRGVTTFTVSLKAFDLVAHGQKLLAWGGSFMAVNKAIGALIAGIDALKQATKVLRQHPLVLEVKRL